MLFLLAAGPLAPKQCALGSRARLHSTQPSTYAPPGVPIEPCAASLPAAAPRRSPGIELGALAHQRDLRAAALVGPDLGELLGLDRGARPDAVLVEGLSQGVRHLVLRHLLDVRALEHQHLRSVLE